VPRTKLDKYSKPRTTPPTAEEIDADQAQQIALNEAWLEDNAADVLEGKRAYELELEEQRRKAKEAGMVFVSNEELREQQEEEERQAYLAEMQKKLDEAGIYHVKPDTVVAGPYDAIKLVHVGDLERDPENYHVDKVECQVRMRDTGKSYHLDIKVGDADWEADGGGVIDATSAGASLARKGIKVVKDQSDDWGRALSSLPAPHPAVHHKYHPQPRRMTNEEVREAMGAQRQRNALHRDAYETSDSSDLFFAGG